jgi:flagellar hook-associated protein 3 FlgL
MARELGIFGSSDMMGSIILLMTSLSINDRDGTGLLLQNVDDSIQHLLTHRASVGARAVRLEGTQWRLLDLELSLTKQLSAVEDADISQLITDLATHENMYQASLIASAKIIQPTLLDFLK